MASFFQDQPAEVMRTPRFRPQQEGGYDLLRQLGMSGLQQDSGDFQPIEDLIRYRHKTETVPSIAQRFASQGAMGSSGFQEEQARAGERMDLGLGALRSQHGMQQQRQSLQMLMRGLSQRDELDYLPEKASPFSRMMGELSGATKPLMQAYLNSQQGGGQFGGEQQQDYQGGGGGNFNLGQALTSVLGGASTGAKIGGPIGAGVGGGVAGLAQLLSYLANRNSGQQQSGSVQLGTPRYKI